MGAQGQDFEMPSPKRQRTESPVEARPAAAEDLDSSHAPVVPQAPTGRLVDGPPAMADEKNQAEAAEGSDMLDVLMQHVESEAGSKAAEANLQVGVEQTPAIEDAQQAQDVNMEDTGASIQTAPAPAPTIEHEPSGTEHAALAQPAGSANDTQHDLSFPPGLEATEKSALDHLQAVANVNDLPPTADTLAQDTLPPATAGAPDAQAAPEAREWETDSSPYESSDSSDTSSDTSDDDSDEDGEEYTLLDPYEQARILMAEDGGGGGGGGGADSDDEGTSRPARGNVGAGLRTTNEKTDEILPKPDVTVTENMPIELLGTVEATIETTVLVKAATPGSYQVLESGSVLCLADRSVIGAVHETLGRVEQPLYTVRFASDTDVRESGVSEKGTKVYYVKDHSSFVFTQPLKAVKGSDASNFHDEEVGDEEMEFSDDEAEAEHKRQIKLRRKGIDPSTVPTPGRGGRGRGQRGGRGGLGGGRGGNYMSNIPESDTASAYGNGSLEMNYDDVEEGETEYTPLRRPETLPLPLPLPLPNGTGMNTSAQMSPQNQSSSSYTPQNQNHNHNQNTRGSHQTQNRGGRGRGSGSHNNNRGRGRGRGGGGNNYHNNNNNPNPNPNPNHGTPQSYNTTNANNNAFPTSMYTQPSYSQQQQQQQYYPPLPHNQPQQQPYFAFNAPPPPPPPQLAHSSGPYNTAVPPSPMTPLAGAGASFQAQTPTQYQNQNQNQNQNQMPWQQYHQNQNQQYQAHMQQYGAQNADAIAQVQRQLEELRRQTQGGGGGWNGAAQQ
ncbi:hypothetical protein LTR24_002994 [Lithohypha guttulata]|uniref:H/ACA ribonucleoprotein complex non-core subunit NAF1 n=1 Tax=Lithohypha guttulata TaxID=1690604 RepID=A0ABR0KGF9_9EURO|nr:hypothetical protein LTR24_002994 [Lithohypha guttulata]